MTITPDPLRRKAAESELRRVKLDADGTPDRKLPNCPGCDHDELHAWRNGPGRYGFSCYLCLYKLELHEDGDKPTVRAAVLNLDSFTADEIEILAGVCTALMRKEHPVVIGSARKVLERVGLKLQAHKPVKEDA